MLQRVVVDIFKLGLATAKTKQYANSYYLRACDGAKPRSKVLRDLNQHVQPG